MSQGIRPNTTPAAAPPPRPKPPVVGVEQATARCGHAVPFELFAPRQDRFRAERRKKLTDRDCPECRKKAQEAKEAAEREAARRRPKKGPPMGPKDRLPHGSRFEAAWDAAQGQWSGVLTVPAAAEGEAAGVFSASASAVFRLLQKLDDLYRASRPAEGPASPEAPA